MIAPIIQLTDGTTALDGFELTWGTPGDVKCVEESRGIESKLRENHQVVAESDAKIMRTGRVAVLEYPRADANENFNDFLVHQVKTLPREDVNKSRKCLSRVHVEPDWEPSLVRRTGFYSNV